MPDAFEITPAAQAQLKLILSKDGAQERPLRFRISVVGGGCSGFQYIFKVDALERENDHVFGDEKSQVIIDDVSLELMKGAFLDYEDELIGAQFVIKNNPQAVASCGCKTSFSIV